MFLKEHGTAAILGSTVKTVKTVKTVNIKK
jgi:hypothetical protein